MKLILRFAVVLTINLTFLYLFGVTLFRQWQWVVAQDLNLWLSIAFMVGGSATQTYYFFYRKKKS